jgi:hypothetical protein
MKVHNEKIQKRAERIAERWRRSLACHGSEVAKAEIDFDLVFIKQHIVRNDKCYPELTVVEHSTLYPILVRMKESVFVSRNKKKKQVVSFRLSERARFKLEHLAEKGGVSRTTVIENLIHGASSFRIAVPENMEEK